MSGRDGGRPSHRGRIARRPREQGGTMDRHARSVTSNSAIRKALTQQTLRSYSLAGENIDG